MPCGGSVLPPTVICLTALTASKHCYQMYLHQDTYCDRGHNQIAADALETQADAVLFLDSDQEFPPDTLDRLVARNKDIVGATYRFRQPPFALMGEEGQGLVEREFIPSGVMLVRRKVFETISYPWFPNIYGKKPSDFVGSDVSFCRKARGLGGFKIWCDYDLSRQVTHIASIPLTFDRGAV